MKALKPLAAAVAYAVISRFAPLTTLAQDRPVRSRADIAKRIQMRAQASRRAVAESANAEKPSE